MSVPAFLQNRSPFPPDHDHEGQVMYFRSTCASILMLRFAPKIFPQFTPSWAVPTIFTPMTNHMFVDQTSKIPLCHPNIREGCCSILIYTWCMVAVIDTLRLRQTHTEELAQE
jgi:hypothetical protein